ncbi:hypothetical protein P378_13945 [Desulforamulus profundi]|uniref:Uncharacterized protein n=1 Tax=Desulforamulus profundi TaxID=1383067 RepID=A0A2C6MDT4_9FIRM|nr:hypothetical protein P378_13945 [Desulforamulus profundi]
MLVLDKKLFLPEQVAADSGYFLLEEQWFPSSFKS